MKTNNLMTESGKLTNVLRNGITTEIQSSTSTTYTTGPEITKEPSLSSVRKLPKKRKFDLSELEDSTYSKPENTITTSATVTCTSNITPPQSMAVDYSYVNINNNTASSSISDVNNSNVIHNSCFVGNNCSSPPKLTPQKITSSPLYYSDGTENKNASVREYYKSNINFSVPSINTNNTPDRNECSEKLNIALHEWIDHRVLAKTKEVYLPGTIRKADSIVGNVWIEFDNNTEELILFTDVLQSGRYHVISDASPTLSQVTVGARVCVRTSGSLDDKQPLSRVFVEGIVFKILTSPVRFVVKLTGPENKEYIVKRADIRLLQPPWLDELENDLEHELPPPLLPFGNISSNNSSNNGTALSMVTSNVYQQSASVLPDLATSISFCRNATSPLHVAAGISNSTCPTSVSVINVENQARRHFEEYSESDDDLRKENILFSSLDGGTK